MVAALLLCGLSMYAARAQEIRGRVVEKGSGEPLVGATVQIENEGKAAVTDLDGFFAIGGLKDSKYTLLVKYVTYRDLILEDVPARMENGQGILAEMEREDEALEGGQVTAVRKKNTEIAAISMARQSASVMNAVSAQEISRSRDSDAGEIIRRIPGVSLIDGKFVMVRGLSQRYNNVWINGGAVPSSEADSRAFSFDIIPSSQIDNILVVKSPVPELPADFSGGFIDINTRESVSENNLSVNVGSVWNTATAFSSFLRKNGKDWYVRSVSPKGDVKLGAQWGTGFRTGGGSLGMSGSVNFTDEYRAVKNMRNNLFGVYDKAHDRSNYLRRSTDNQYSRNKRLGAMLNFSYLDARGSRYELKNILNFIGTDRYTSRTGVNAQSNREAGAEYYTRNRLSYNGQITGRHSFGNDRIDWNAGYSYADRHMPNRRRYTVDDALTDDGTLALTSANDINIEKTALDENIASLSVNEKHEFEAAGARPYLSAGIYGEYRGRKYRTREHLFNWDPSGNTLPADFRYMDIPTLLSDPQYRGQDKLYLIEEMHMRNNYDANGKIGAAYAAMFLPLGKLSVYGGVRYEYFGMELISNLRDYEVSRKSRFYDYSDFFPSFNATYEIRPGSQLRLSYGKSVNRAEFRELSSSVYYDFDLASNIQGNADLKPCFVQNADIRYEWYPSEGEIVSLALFYKHFRNPIESTYTVSGGTDLIYSFENADRAESYGAEAEIRKSLAFMGLKNFGLSANLSLIHSRVSFSDKSRNENRAMQGQSPYLVNAGVFYSSDKSGISFSVLYNRIGRRILGVGRSEGTTGSENTARVPDSYEMPRNVLDISFTKELPRKLELTVYARDILDEKVIYRQYAEGVGGKKVRQTVKDYRPGCNAGVQLTWKIR